MSNVNRPLPQTAPTPSEPMQRDQRRSDQSCIHRGCARHPRVCRECVRAVSFKWWGAIARHYTRPDPRCQLCEIGQAEVCAECFINDVLLHRAQMRELGNPIGEPEPPDVVEIFARGVQEGRRRVSEDSLS